MIKAIETEYQGIKFRSRLESRWAVFFKYSGIKWEYEPEGFDLNGTWYLPDFYLPDLKIFVEIKPSYIWDQDSEKLRNLLRFFSSSIGPIFCSKGLPQELGTLFCFRATDSGKALGQFEAKFDFCHKCLKPSLYVRSATKGAALYGLNWEAILECNMYHPRSIGPHMLTGNASVAAKSYRFERGR